MSGILKMDFGGRSVLGFELLNNSNCKILRSFLESLLVGKDLWEVVRGNNRVVPVAIEENAEALKDSKMVNAKDEFILKRTINNDLFKHIISCGLLSIFGIPMMGYSIRRMCSITFFKSKLAK